jgi:glycosyltransferase involved in cell wall biosynthesis
MASTSVALCTYNGERFLPQQLESLAAQTVLPSELVICDDASSDGSMRIIEEFAKNALFPVRIFNNPKNLGYIKNFEKAISLCSKNIIFLCDHDDYWEKTKLEKVLNIFDTEEDVGMVLHGFHKIDCNGSPYIESEEKYGLNKISANQLDEAFRSSSIEVFLLPHSRAWCGCMTAFRRKFNNVIIPIFPGKGHDDWILKVIAPLSEIRFLPEPLIRYRIHAWNNNSNEVGEKPLVYFLQRSARRVNAIWRGHSKRNFYRSLISRVEQSKMNLQPPELIKLYKKYIKFF